ITMAGGRSAIVDSYPDFRFHADRVESAITSRTKLLMLNSPSNPTGVVMTEAEVRAAVDIAKKHDLLILSDEIYEPFLYDSGRQAAGSGQQRTADLNSSPAASRPLPAASSSLPSAAKLYENTLILRG